MMTLIFILVGAVAAYFFFTFEWHSAITSRTHDMLDNFFKFLKDMKNCKVCHGLLFLSKSWLLHNSIRL